MAAKLQLALCVAMVVLGTALAKSKWETDKADQQRAVLLTKVSMYHEQLQASAKDYAKFTGQKYPAGVVSLEPTAAEAGHQELVDTIGKRAANAMAELKEIYTKMNRTASKPHSDIVSDLIESAAQDYGKATGTKFNDAMKKDKEKNMLIPRNGHTKFEDVLKLMKSVGKDAAVMNNETFTKFKGAQKAIKNMRGRGMNPDIMHRPELAESEDFDDDTLAHESPSELKESLGVDPFEDSYEDDKATADAMLAQQEQGSESIGVDGIDGEDDGDMIDDGDGAGIPL